ncbi:DoxX family membrane protein [Flagellimonas olearia]|uniref:DoxX family membrane protein n=1 Tax=Flagellimonas olearia TaxID=552546 RepID=A0A6I1DYU1_9FLAO|nr:DoxX family membrane protein [Allomuricauda olearia]KAB7529987.1 DoxX family membrane protein [Allomuricauda olearia]
MKQTAKHNFLAITIGVVYLWFGALKFFPDLSPAEGLAKSTIHMLTFGLIPDAVSIILLALWETMIGVCLIFNLWRRTMAVLALVHMVFTFTPLLFFPDQAFGEGPLYLTLVGQYIIKNLIIIAALLNLVDFSAENIKNKLKYSIPSPAGLHRLGLIGERIHQKNLKKSK